MNGPFEIERKYLIERPDPSWIAAQPDYRQMEITQTYLAGEPGAETRVRCVRSGGRVEYFRTVKRAVSGIRREEIESQITQAEYAAALSQADPARRRIDKTRLRFRYGAHLLEIDLYPFFDGYAILEIELEAEEEEAPIPEQIRVVREVTRDPRFKNAVLAANPRPMALLAGL